MKFYKKVKANSPANIFSVYMKTDKEQNHYVCDYIAEDTSEAQEVNELGLTLRSRLKRSRGIYAMLEGTIFNPERLLGIIVSFKSYDVESFTGKEYLDGHVVLKIEADGCVNKYLIYDKRYLEKWTDRLKEMKNS